MNLLDLPLELLTNLLQFVDTRELLILGSLAKFSGELRFALSQIQPQPVVLKVETIPNEIEYIGPKTLFRETTLLHSSCNRISIPYEDSSAIFFDTLKYFNQKAKRSVILRFESNEKDDMSYINELLIKCEELLGYDFKFRLSIFKLVSVTEKSPFQLPTSALEKFSWSQVLITSPNFSDCDPPLEKYVENIPTISLSWLKNSDDLRVIRIGEKFKIENNINDLYFEKLKRVKFESFDKSSVDPWKEFIFRHSEVIKTLSLRHYLGMYNYRSMEKLETLELIGLNSYNFYPLQYLMEREMKLIIKGQGAMKAVVYECIAAGRDKDYSNIVIAEHNPQPNLKAFLKNTYKVRFMPIHNWESFPFTV
ncbi:hypothetical protein DFJ63DRAFT_313138 [Scheffersomyces coipomensis]|uniref:uncharacterized protein n=1 Tax=Scheffersomyces coipomensis TaxID=1788519 RepID=UPI00315D2A9D